MNTCGNLSYCFFNLVIAFMNSGRIEQTNMDEKDCLNIYCVYRVSYGVHESLFIQKVRTSEELLERLEQ